jgi:hypothetical protein
MSWQQQSRQIQICARTIRSIAVLDHGLGFIHDIENVTLVFSSVDPFVVTQKNRTEIACCNRSSCVTLSYTPIDALVIVTWFFAGSFFLF